MIYCTLIVLTSFCSYVTRVCRLVEGVPTDTAAVANHSCVHNSIMEVQAHSINWIMHAWVICHCSCW